MAATRGPNSALDSVFSIVVRGRTYARMLYLALGLPIGMFYTVFILGAIALGIALTPVGLGVLMLIGVLMGSWILLGIDRELAAALIGVDLAPLVPPRSEAGGFRADVGAYLKHSGTWKSLAYVMLRLPIGAATFALVFGLVAVASTLAAAPITLIASDLDFGFWRIDEYWEAFVAAAFGPPAGVAALHVIDRAAVGYGRAMNALMTG